MEKMPIGVFASIGAGLGAGIEKVKLLGIPTVQIHAPGKDRRTQAEADAVRKAFADANITISLVFCGFTGESYASIQAVRDTVGLVPMATRAARAQEVREIAQWAKWVGGPGIGIHVGFIPENAADPSYKDLVKTVAGLCDHCAGLGLRMHLETGQETADTLYRFIQDVKKPNLAVNFDPANMILYGSGEPIAALKKVGRWVKSCHCKDAKWSAEPGKVWGVETPLGEGQVGIETFVKTLASFGYEGPLTIEREISGDKQFQDIRNGMALLQKIKATL